MNGNKQTTALGILHLALVKPQRLLSFLDETASGATLPDKMILATRKVYREQLQRSLTELEQMTALARLTTSLLDHKGSRPTSFDDISYHLMCEFDVIMRSIDESYSFLTSVDSFYLKNYLAWAYRAIVAEYTWRIGHQLFPAYSAVISKLAEDEFESFRGAKTLDVLVHDFIEMHLHKEAGEHRLCVMLTVNSTLIRLPSQKIVEQDGVTFVNINL